MTNDATTRATQKSSVYRYHFNKRLPVSFLRRLVQAGLTGAAELLEIQSTYAKAIDRGTSSLICAKGAFMCICPYTFEGVNNDCYHQIDEPKIDYNDADDPVQCRKEKIRIHGFVHDRRPRVDYTSARACRMHS